MLIRNWMPFVRLLLRLRMISVFRGRDKLLRICFDLDRAPEASLEFSFDGVRYSGLIAFLADWSAFFCGAYEKVGGWSSAGRICRDRVLCRCSIWGVMSVTIPCSLRRKAVRWAVSSQTLHCGPRSRQTRGFPP